MGSNNNQKQQQGYGPNPGTSGSDPRGRIQNQSQYQQQRYESQQGPMASAMAFNYGRGTEADYGNYTDIMNQYRQIASGGGQSAGGGGDSGGGGGGGGGYSPFLITPERVAAERASVRSLGPLERVKASDPFASYGGYQEFSQTGGYSPQDISNMRARGVSPIRAAYANAERNVGQQRSLQGGYSPNAIAAQARMAREQGQSMADATQNVEAGLAKARNEGRLAGLGGMSNIEQQRLAAQMEGDMFNANQAFQGQQFDIGNERDVSMFNAGQGNEMGRFNAEMDFQGQQYNAQEQARAQAANNAAGQAAADRAAYANAQNTQDRLSALSGMRTLYGTTPGMSSMFGDQLINAVGQGGNFGLGLMGRDMESQQLPGRYDQTMGRAKDLYNTGAQIAYPWLNQNQNKQPQSYLPQNRGINIDYSGVGSGGPMIPQSYLPRY